MKRPIGCLLRAAAVLACLGALSCGGGGSSSLPGSGSSSTGTMPSGPNVVSVTVSSGPTASSPAINTLYTTVTVCVPGTDTCQTIDNIQVDTGSYGLRLLGQVLTLSLPISTINNGETLLECTDFVDGYSWGPVATADVTIASEKASSLPVQIIGYASYTTVPSDCSSSAGTQNEEDTVAAFGANGLLGIGPFGADCGEACASAPQAAAYYGCTSASSCSATAVPVASQVQNPIPFFATDNNGSIIELPSVASSGAATVSGSLIFGIDTESNNQLGSMTILAVGSSTSSNPLPGDFFTDFQGTTDESFIDSGSNSYYFPDSQLTSCANPNSEFYCPAGATTLTATLESAVSGGASAQVSFTIANFTDELENDPTFAAFPDVGGTLSINGVFDWGLPFFYGRSVAYAIEGRTTSAGAGPFVAF